MPPMAAYTSALLEIKGDENEKRKTDGRGIATNLRILGKVWISNLQEFSAKVTLASAAIGGRYERQLETKERLK